MMTKRIKLFNCDRVIYYNPEVCNSPYEGYKTIDRSVGITKG